MKCSNCGKENANIIYKQNINGKETILNLCDECSNELGILNTFDDIFKPMILDFDYILPEQIKCKECGYTLSKYKSTGLLGCPKCYSIFRKEMDIVLQRIQVKNRHLIDEKKDESEIDRLKRELKELIEKEKFEDAAIVRDKIKEIEK